MVANYRCGEIKDEAFAKVKPEVEALTARSDVAIVEQFGETCFEIMKKATEHYKNAGKQYN